MTKNVIFISRIRDFIKVHFVQNVLFRTRILCQSQWPFIWHILCESRLLSSSEELGLNNTFCTMGRYSLGHWSTLIITFKGVVWLFLFVKKNMNDYFSFIFGMGNIGRQIIINALEAVPSILMLIQLSECWLIADIMSKMSTLYPYSLNLRNNIFCLKMIWPNF